MIECFKYFQRQTTSLKVPLVYDRKLRWRWRLIMPLLPLINVIADMLTSSDHIQLDLDSNELSQERSEAIRRRMESRAAASQASTPGTKVTTIAPDKDSNQP